MTKEPSPRAYSYIRFSTPEQIKGDSLRRQLEAAEKYCALKGLVLDDELTFRDYGVSAYRAANAEVGRLGDFLLAIEFKDIEAGSYLIVESLDRLSRAKPRKAVRLLERICEAGITVVTLDDGREYTEDILDDDPTALMVALLVAARANEESEKKARRLSAAWDNKRRHAKDKPLTAICPGWLKLNDQRTAFEVDEARAEIVRGIYRDTLSGKGQHSIASDLNKQGVPVFGRGNMWHRSYLSKLLANEAVVGTYRPHKMETINGKQQRVPLEPVLGYYPAILDIETFERVLAMASGRSAGGSRTKVSSVLAGLAKCPLCGSTMTRVNKGIKRSRPSLICTVAKGGGGCRYKQVRLEGVEDAILDDIHELARQLPAPDAKLNSRFEELIREDSRTSFEVDNILEAIEASGHSRALLDRLAKLEARREEFQLELNDLTDRIGDALSNRTKDTVTELVKQCDLRPSNIPQINAILRQLFTEVEVDFTRGELWFRWRHSDEDGKLMYAWPEELVKGQ